MNRLETLQQQIADGAARRDIEIYCKPMAWEGDIVTHYDSVPRDPELAETIAMAVEYLTIRGLLARHTQRPNWVRVDITPFEAAKAAARQANKEMDECPFRAVAVQFEREHPITGEKFVDWGEENQCGQHVSIGIKQDRCQRCNKVFTY